MFPCDLSELLLFAVGSFAVFALREYILLVWCLVYTGILINCIFKQIVDIFFNKAYYKES